MRQSSHYDAIIIGGSYAGMSAALALGRSLREVLVIDSAKPCNRYTLHSHNLLTQDGSTPAEINERARRDLGAYETVTFLHDLAVGGVATENGFDVSSASGETFSAEKLPFATGVRDILPEIPGFAECWGKSVIHCPYCHGYEVRRQMTGILGNGDYGYEFSKQISNWTSDLTLYTNGESRLTAAQTEKLGERGIGIVGNEVEGFEHTGGRIARIVFRDGSTAAVKALYAKVSFEQHSDTPERLGCEINDIGYISVDPFQRSTRPGIYACGDSTTFLRAVSTALATGTTAGAILNRDSIEEAF